MKASTFLLLCQEAGSQLMDVFGDPVAGVSKTPTVSTIVTSAISAGITNIAVRPVSGHV